MSSLYWSSWTGDLGQTFDSNRTLTHHESNPTKGQTLLFVGDLSYADDYPFHDNNRWDTWGRFVERSNAYQPWIWAAGNHEIDFAPELVCIFYKVWYNFLSKLLNICMIKYVHVLQGEENPFKPFTHRYHVPYKASGSTSPLWYSIKRASAYIIVMSSYSSFGKKFLI